MKGPLRRWWNAREPDTSVQVSALAVLAFGVLFSKPCHPKEDARKRILRYASCGKQHRREEKREKGKETVGKLNRANSIDTCLAPYTAYA